MDQSKTVFIRSFPTVGEALICKSLLEGCGIACKLMGDTIAGVLPVQNKSAEVNVTVLEKDAEKAKGILMAHFDQHEFSVESAKSHKKP